MSRVLIVDDEVISSSIVRAALEAAGYFVSETHDPFQALEQATQREVDAIVLDLVMPGKSGLEVLHDLRADPRTRNVPVLMLSARSEAADRVQGLREGADDYLAKPFDPSELVLRLSRLIQWPPVSHGLTGRLENFSLGDLLHSLRQSDKSGCLVLAGPPVGRVLLSEGTVVSASYGELTGRDAVLAMLELAAGRFELETRESLAAPSSWSRQDVEIHEILLESAWLSDELAAHHLSLPADEARLALSRGGGRLEPALPRLPFTEVLTALSTGRAETLADLVHRVPAAPKRIRLAVAFLAEWGVLAAAPG